MHARGRQVIQARRGQLMLPLGAPPRTVRGRPGGQHREDSVVYDAVIALRAAGRRVYRCGGLHQVNGALLTTRQLLRLAAERR